MEHGLGGDIGEWDPGRRSEKFTHLKCTHRDTCTTILTVAQFATVKD